MQGMGEIPEVIDLCRMMVKNELSWESLTNTLKAMDEPNPEAIRLVIVAYLTATVMGAKGSRAPELLGMLAEFCRPINPQDKMAPILLAFGRYIFD